jgi:filamentous hemagglutinin family protein
MLSHRPSTCKKSSRSGAQTDIQAFPLFRSVIVSAFLCFAAICADAGVTPNGLGSAVSHNGLDFSITGGTQRGANLFHSFSQFNLIKDESATFTGPNSVQNILARVTGGPSSIDGTIKSDIQGANLFFLNPAGVMFGANAKLDVSGSVAISTANYIKMVGGGRFNATLGGQDSLSSAPVSAFGFLGSNPASVEFQQSQLSRPPGTALEVVAGDVAFDGAGLSVQSGGLTVFSAASAGELPLNPLSAFQPDFSNATFSKLGSISLINRSSLTVDSGGTVAIRGGTLGLNVSRISSDTSNGGDVFVNVDGQLSITSPDEVVFGSAGIFTFGGDIVVQAGDLVMAPGSRIQSAGNISIAAKSVSIQGRFDQEFSAPAGIGSNTGNVTVRTGDLAIIDLAGIFSAGNVVVKADSLFIDGLSSEALQGGDALFPTGIFGRTLMRARAATFLWR